MLSAFRYRLYPKPEQETRLNRSLLLLRNLYNDLKAGEMRRRRYREEHRSTSKTGTMMEMKTRLLGTEGRATLSPA